MTRPTDAIVIGAGHNGLVCAAYLARAGMNVVCLESSDVAGGMSLGDAMGKHPRVFSPLHASMVRAGEQGGFLEDVLERIAVFSEKQDELRAAEEQNRRLRLERALLTAPERIERLAVELGMVHPEPEQIRALGAGEVARR